MSASRTLTFSAALFAVRLLLIALLVAPAGTEAHFLQPPLLCVANPRGAGFLLPTMHGSYTGSGIEYLSKINYGRLRPEYYETAKPRISPLLSKYRLSESDQDFFERKTEATLSRVIVHRGGAPGRVDPVITRTHPYILADLIAKGCEGSTTAGSSMDKMAIDDAHRRNVPIDSLESFEESFVSLLKINALQWSEFIISTSEKATSGECDSKISYLSLLSGLVDSADFEGVHTQMAAYHLKTFGSTLLFDAYLSKERNVNIARKIVASIEVGDRPLITVGAAHFAGDFSVPKELNKLGAEVFFAKTGPSGVGVDCDRGAANSSEKLLP